MGLFQKTAEQRLLQEALKIAKATAQPNGTKAQGGGGGVETRWRGASRLLRSMVSWVPGLGSPQRDLNTSERNMLVARSRDAMRNHLLARAAIGRLRTNVVGTGLVCRSQVDADALGVSAQQAEQLNGALDRIWSLYADNPRECDAEASLNHYQLQALVLVSAMVGGDVFIATPDQERPGCLFSTRLQLIETDRVSNPNGGLDTANLVDGIEFDALGAPVRYHVSTDYPGEFRRGHTLRWEPLPVFGRETGRRRIMHVMADKERPGQKRGAPYLAPVLEPLQKLERYSSAELMAAVLSAFFTVFIEKTDAFDDGKMTLAALGQGESSRSTDDAAGDDSIQLGEGAIIDLGKGEKAAVANPARPNAQFDPFFMAVVKEIGAALELPLEELLLHYNSSYSAARAAMLQAWRYYSLRRWWLTCDFCQPSRELIIDEAVARGLIDLPGYADPAKRRAYCQALWIGPARGAIDELKEAKAARERIDIGVSNETLETAAMTGEPWQQVYRQRVREVQQRRADGLQRTDTPPAVPASANNPDSPDSEQE
ncbi:phage portal protein [Atopomonas sediminilitoris]|uniref:phage portal protein n=1 Tax=Atopomonas sediminilitoris TaxID=2919919 RepID=UPI001F4E7355|nr:phage portal protein [Atopomonas sediminilitoris]MCJ8168641.1 phage portal protein [Atopomonas sediminilitoris]